MAIIQKIKNSVFRYIRHENKFGKYYGVSLRNAFKNGISWHSYGNRIFVLAVVMFSISGWLAMKHHIILGSFVIFLFLGIAIKTLWSRFFGRKIGSGRAYESSIRNFIYENGLYESNADGLLSEIDIGYVETKDTLEVYIQKHGNKYQKWADQFSEPLESKLDLEFYVMEQNSKYVQYIFRKFPIERQHISELPFEDTSLKIPVFDGFAINLRNNYSMLVSGASGSGKSFFTYFYLTRFISQIVGNRHALIYAIDPKQSDLYKLFKTSGMPEENYGTSNADAFRIVQSFIDEMDRRMAVYSESDMFNSVAVDLGLEPALLVIEEYSSLVAGMDKKMRVDFESKIAVITQKGRQLSMGATIIMQQPRSDLLGTNIREQLQNSVFLGNPSREAAGMMFGTSDLPSVSGVGAGLYSVEQSQPKTFESPIFVNDVFDVILPVWVKVAQSYKDNNRVLND